MSPSQSFIRIVAAIATFCGGSLFYNTNLHAADVFTPAKQDKSIDYEGRIARLEELLKKTAAEKTPELPPAPPTANKLIGPVPESLIARSAKTKVVNSDAGLDATADQERVIGVMNEHEIYVFNGVVRSRPTVSTPKAILNQLRDAPQ